MLSKMLQQVRRLEDVVESELQWILQESKNCIEFTLLDRSVRKMEGDDMKLKGKITFYTTLSGGYVLRGLCRSESNPQTSRRTPLQSTTTRNSKLK